MTTTMTQSEQPAAAGPHIHTSNASDGCRHEWFIRWMDPAGAVLGCRNCPAIASWTAVQVANLIVHATTVSHH